MESNLGTQIEGKKVLGRLIDFVGRETSQKECGYLSDCFYVRKRRDLGDMTPNQANTYLTLICERYPEACEYKQSSSLN